jgi:two-component system sensor histidine kinase DegS
MAGKELDIEASEAVLKKGALKRILNHTIETIEEGKTQIFDIYEAARTEVDASKKLLEDLRFQVRQTIERVDALEKKEQQEKQQLVLVSSNFKNYSEERIKESYDRVKNVQVELAIERDKESSLRKQRDALEIRLRRLGEMLHQSEHLALAIGSVLNYLSSQVSGVVWQIEAVQKDKLVGARIIKAVEEERYRMSRELHDGPAQDMANLMFQTSICEKLIDRSPEEAKQGLKEMRQEVRDCLTSVRQVIFDMRPMALDDLGLAAAIQQLGAKFQSRGMLEVQFEVEGTSVKLSKYVEIAAFRIVQEALNNVIHHAGTNRARVRMLYTRSALSILVEDEGKGFDPQAEPTEDELAEQQEEQGFEQEGHFGLVSMKERAKIVGAELNISSQPGKGTRVHLRIPIHPEELGTPKKGSAS